MPLLPTPRYALLPPSWSSRWTRVGLVVAYTLFTLSGLASIFYPVQTVEAQTHSWQRITWTVFFIGGSGCATLGAAFDVWIGELIGLPLLITVFLIFGVAALLSDRPSASTLSGGLFLIGMATYFTTRWIQVWHIQKLAAGPSNGRSL